VLDRDELVEPHGLLPREMERERVDREVRVASRLLEVALAAYRDVLALDHMLHRLVAQRAHLMHVHSCHVHGMHGTCTAHARGCTAGCAGAGAWPRTSGLASAIKLPSSSTVELYGRAPPHSQLRRVREKLPPGGVTRVAAVPRSLLTLRLQRSLLTLERSHLSLPLTLASARCVTRCSCVNRRRASPPICLRVRLCPRKQSGAIGQGGEGFKG